MSVRAVMLPPQICAHVAIFQLLIWSLMKTILTTAVKYSIVEGSFLTKMMVTCTSAKVDISSHCAIPLLNHTHFKIHIPNTIKPDQTISYQNLWSKSEITKCKMSTKGGG